jgi:hypothetical protein
MNVGQHVTINPLLVNALDLFFNKLTINSLEFQKRWIANTLNFSPKVIYQCTFNRLSFIQNFVQNVSS